MSKNLSLFEEERLTLPKSIALSIESLRYYGSLYDHWAIAFSGGKDSAATVTLVAHLIETGEIPRPKTLTVLYADTRQELPPLHNSALGILAALESRGFQTRVVAQPEWSYLAPLQRLRPLYWEIKKPQYRHRKHGEINKNGSLAAKQNRLGPLTMEARRWMLDQVLGIQAEVNRVAIAQSRPTISLINDEELTRIEELMALNTFPEKWDGSEPHGDEWLPEILSDGSIQPLLFDLLESV